ncbi:hypothetical protein [Oceanithermus sp.]
MRYACPSCGRWVRPLIEVEAVVCVRCGVYARREEEEQPALMPREKPASRADPEPPERRRR